MAVFFINTPGNPQKRNTASCLMILEKQDAVLLFFPGTLFF